MKTLYIKSDGRMVKGGHISYNFDANGTIDFSLEITAHYLMSDHKITQSGTYHVSPEFLKSATVKPKEVFRMGKVKLSITEVSGKRAIAEVEIDGLGNGVADISLAGVLIELVSISAAGFVYGMPVNLEAA